MFNKISVKVALYVNLALLLVIAAGSFYLIEQQSRSLEGLAAAARALSRYRVHGLLCKVNCNSRIFRFFSRMADR